MACHRYLSPSVLRSSTEVMKLTGYRFSRLFHSQSSAAGTVLISGMSPVGSRSVSVGAIVNGVTSVAVNSPHRHRSFKNLP